MDILSLLLQLVAGAFGGNVAGAMWPRVSMGPRGNALAGMIGGALGGTLLAAALTTHAASGATMDPDLGALFAQIAGGGAGGAVAAMLVGFLQRILDRA